MLILKKLRSFQVSDVLYKNFKQICGENNATCGKFYEK
jgi:hypothetical protein